MSDKDYASELAAKWDDKIDGGYITIVSAIEGAVREALKRAMELADYHATRGEDGFITGHTISMAIRALGAKP